MYELGLGLDLGLEGPGLGLGLEGPGLGLEGPGLVNIPDVKLYVKHLLDSEQEAI